MEFLSALDKIIRFWKSGYAEFIVYFNAKFTEIHFNRFEIIWAGISKTVWFLFASKFEHLPCFLKKYIVLRNMKSWEKQKIIRNVRWQTFLRLIKMFYASFTGDRVEFLNYFKNPFKHSTIHFAHWKNPLNFESKLKIRENYRVYWHET